MNTLSAENLHKKFKSRVVVDSVSIELKSGDIVGLLGPNGAGKTTCFYMLAGLIQCNDGKIHLDKQNITRMPMHTRAKQGIGYLPQEFGMYENMTAWDFLHYMGMLKKLYDKV